MGKSIGRTIVSKIKFNKKRDLGWVLGDRGGQVVERDQEGQCRIGRESTERGIHLCKRSDSKGQGQAKTMLFVDLVFSQHLLTIMICLHFYIRWLTPVFFL